MSSHNDQYIASCLERAMALILKARTNMNANGYEDAAVDLWLILESVDMALQGFVRPTEVSDHEE